MTVPLQEDLGWNTRPSAGGYFHMLWYPCYCRYICFLVCELQCCLTVCVCHGIIMSHIGFSGSVVGMPALRTVHSGKEKMLKCFFVKWNVLFIIVLPFPIEEQLQQHYDTLWLTFTHHTINLNRCMSVGTSPSPSRLENWTQAAWVRVPLPNH